MMDFNIVTFHTAYNYGALLQAYALKEYSSSLGYKSGIYDYRPFYMKSYNGLKGKVTKLIEAKDKDVRSRMRKRFDEFSDEFLGLNTDTISNTL